MHAQVFRFGVLAFGFGGVELTLTALGAVHLELRGHLAQRLGDLVVAAAQRVGPADRLVERGGDGIRRAARQLGAQFGDESGRPARLFTVGLGLDRELVVGRRRPLQGQPLACGGQFGLCGARASRGRRWRWVALSPSRFAAASATLRCVSQSAMACWCAATAASSSARAAAGSAAPAVPQARLDGLAVAQFAPGAFAIRRRRRRRPAPRTWRSACHGKRPARDDVDPAVAPPRHRRPAPAPAPPSEPLVRHRVWPGYPTRELPAPPARVSTPGTSMSVGELTLGGPGAAGLEWRPVRRPDRTSMSAIATSSMWAEASSAWPAARSTATAAVSIVTHRCRRSARCLRARGPRARARAVRRRSWPSRVVEPVGLVAVGHPLDGAAGGVDAGLRASTAARASSAAASAASCTSAAVVSSSRASCRRGLQFGDRGGPLVDVGTQPCAAR